MISKVYTDVRVQFVPFLWSTLPLKYPNGSSLTNLNAQRWRLDDNKYWMKVYTVQCTLCNIPYFYANNSTPFRILKCLPSAHRPILCPVNSRIRVSDDTFRTSNPSWFCIRLCPTLLRRWWSSVLCKSEMNSEITAAVKALMKFYATLRFQRPSFDQLRIYLNGNSLTHIVSLQAMHSTSTVHTQTALPLRSHFLFIFTVFVFTFPFPVFRFDFRCARKYYGDIFESNIGENIVADFRRSTCNTCW